MNYFEYISPDDRVLYNIEENTYGHKILSRLNLNLYLINRDFADSIIFYNNTTDKSKVPITMDEDGNQIDYNNIKNYLDEHFPANSSEIIIKQHTIS